MKILLIQPPLPNFEEDPYPPLGLAYIAAVLENNEYEVRIIDMPPLKMRIEDIKEILLNYQADIVGITCVAVNFRYCVKVANIAKQMLPSCIIVVGGPHVTFTAEKTLHKHPSIDIVVRGEGEITMLEIVKTLGIHGYSLDKLRTIRGISFRAKDGNLISTKDRPFIKELDTLPYPARHLLPMEKYKSLTKYTSIVATRGCMHHCIYCNASAFWKHKVRLRKPVKIAEEIRVIKEIYNTDHIKFVDDNFLHKSAWTTELLGELEKLRIKWICNARVDMVDEKIIKKAAQSGCEKIIFGIESLSPEVQHIIGKNIKIDKNGIGNILEICHENNIQTKLNFIIGLPQQSYEDIREIVNLLSKWKPTEIAINPLIPYPGTYLFKHFKELGVYYDIPEWWETEHAKLVFPSNVYLSKKDISSGIITMKEQASAIGIRTMEAY